MYKRVKQQKGMALVMAIMTAFILMALVASLFWVISATQRQAEYARNSAAALNLAEAGVADAIYRLNYCTGPTASNNYPFLGTYIPFGSTSSDTVAVSSPTAQNPDNPGYLTDLPSPASLPYAAYGIRHTLGSGYYSVGLVDNATVDTIIVVGVSKGTKRIITVSLRGNNTSSTRQGATQGISEAFNKHAIYANKVAYSAGTVGGNIVYANYDAAPSPTNPTTWPASNPITNPYTKTTFELVGFGVPTLSYTPTPPSSSMPSVPIISWTYTDPGGPYPTIYDPDGIGTAPEADLPSVGEFTFTLTDTLNQTTEVIGNVTLSGSTAVSSFLKADNITINSTTVSISSGSTLYADTSDINFSSAPTANITGVVAAVNNITIANLATATATDTIISQNGAVTLNGGNFTGPIISGGNITLQAGTYTINNSSTTNNIAPIYGGGAININASVILSLTPGAQQKAAILNYSTTGAVSVTIASNLTPTYTDTNGAQAAIVAYSSTGTANVNLGNGGAVTIEDAPAGSGKGRVIYSYGTGVSGITLNTIGTVYGTLVTNNTVTLTSGTLTYDKTFFVTPANNNFATDIYQGFSGGRRVFVPVYSQWGLK